MRACICACMRVCVRACLCACTSASKQVRLFENLNIFERCACICQCCGGSQSRPVHSETSYINKDCNGPGMTPSEIKL